MRYPLVAASDLLLIGVASAQTFFTPGNAVPAFGTYDYAWYSELADPASPIDTNATTATWDFSATQIADAFYYQVTIGPAAETPYAASSGGADICWTYNYSWGNDHWYYRNGPDSLVWTANLTDIFGDDVYENEACRQFQFGYPAAIGDMITEDVTDCEGPINGYPKIWRRKLIGTGTLITSLGTFNNVLLVKDRLSAWNEMGVPVYTESFQWYLPNNALEPLAIWRENQGLNYLYMRVLTPTTGVKGSARASGPVVLPNPVSDVLTIQSADGLPLGQMNLRSVDGRSVSALGHLGAGRIQLEVMDLSPGLYAVERIIAGRTEVTRFIKE